MKANLFKVLGHSKRLEIINLLRGHELTVGQIVQMTALRQSTVSQHLRLLKKSKLVTTHQVGKEIYYTLNTKVITELVVSLQNLTHAYSSIEPSVIDPICNMSLTPKSAKYTSEYNGVRHYFCGKGCLKEFSSIHIGVA